MNLRFKKTHDLFSLILTTALISAVIIAIISYTMGFDLNKETYADLKQYFFKPLKIWILPVIGSAMFSIFFRSTDSSARKFFILLADILLLYVISTLIANIYAFNMFALFPFQETIQPLLNEAETATFNKTKSGKIPTVILVMLISVASSFICRYPLHRVFAFFSKNVGYFFSKILVSNALQYIPFIKNFNENYQKACKTKNNIDYSVALINLIDKAIFLVLMIILLLAPLAVYSSFLQILHDRGFQFFADLGKFILCYSTILLSYQFIIMPLVRNIFCFGIKGDNYKSFLKKSLPVMATAGTTASSIATLAVNIKAAQTLNIPEDMKNKGHNRALMPIGATFNMDGTSMSLVIYFLLAANLAGMTVSFWWVILMAIGLSIGTAAVPSASLIMLTSMYSTFGIPSALTGKLLSIIIAVDPIHDRVRTVVNTWGDLTMMYIIQSKRGILSRLQKH